MSHYLTAADQQLHRPELNWKWKPKTKVSSGKTIRMHMSVGFIEKRYFTITCTSTRAPIFCPSSCVRYRLLR